MGSVVPNQHPRRKSSAKLSKWSKVMTVLISVVFVVYGFSIISPFAYVYSSIIDYWNDGLFIALMSTFFSLPLSFLVSDHYQGIFGILGEVKFKTWLIIHGLFTNVVCFAYPLVIGGLGVIMIYLPPLNPPIKAFIPFVVFSSLLMYLLTFLALWSILNLLGMGYRSIEMRSLLGVSAFVKIAKVLLQRKEPLGIGYLLKALNMLKNNITHEGYKIDQLNKAINIVDCIYTFKSKEVPYHDLQILSSELMKQPITEHLPDILKQFTDKQSTSWSISFIPILRSRKSMLERWGAIITAIGTILAAGATLLPETTRNIIIEYLSSLGTTENIQTIMSIVFLFIIFHIFSRIMEFYFNPHEIRKFL